MLDALKDAFVVLAFLSTVSSGCTWLIFWFPPLVSAWWAVFLNNMLLVWLLLDNITLGEDLAALRARVPPSTASAARWSLLANKARIMYYVTRVDGFLVAPPSPSPPRKSRSSSL